MKYGIVVHGGAWSIPDSVKEDHVDGVKNACEIGYKLLKEQVDAIDIVEQVISTLEDDPTFDAGRGSHLNSAGQVEMDAIIASTNYKIGAVSAIQYIQNPIQAARVVMEQSEHVMLTGLGATEFAVSNGLPKIGLEKLLVGRELETYNQLRNKENFTTKDPFNPKKEGFGTVGCVVVDQTGKIAIGVSTGGTPHKLAGRVGDTPIWGCGGFVNETAGCAATGYGEDLIRVMISHRVVQYIENGMSPQQASDQAINDLALMVDGLGGVISISSSGVGIAFNTKRMAFAYQLDDLEMKYGIEAHDLKT